jgi:hypothetical protein
LQFVPFFPNPEVISDERLQQRNNSHPEMASVMSPKPFQDLDSHDVQVLLFFFEVFCTCWRCKTLFLAVTYNIF